MKYHPSLFRERTPQQNNHFFWRPRSILHIVAPILNCCTSCTTWFKGSILALQTAGTIILGSSQG